MKNVVFYLMKGDRIVFHQQTNRKLWKEFFEGKSYKLPSAIIDDVDKFFSSHENGLMIENCTECHVLDEKNGIEKICSNLSNEELRWETKNKGDINQ